MKLPFSTQVPLKRRVLWAGISNVLNLTENSQRLAAIGLSNLMNQQSEPPVLIRHPRWELLPHTNLTPPFTRIFNFVDFISVENPSESVPSSHRLRNPSRRTCETGAATLSPTDTRLGNPKMTLKSLVDIVDTCPPDDGWGCAVTNDITLNGVPYAPFSKGDKLGRVADWTDGKDRDGRGRSQYNRNFRGKSSH